MGEVQIEILKNQIAERFGEEVDFGTGSIVYKETIEEAVEGCGHFEPLRHYAEVLPSIGAQKREEAEWNLRQIAVKMCWIAIGSD